MPLTSADDAFIDRLRADLPDDTIRQAEPRYLEEPRGRWAGSPGWVALPRDTTQVAALVRHCADAGVGIIPYGGGTGLVGGQVAQAGPTPLIISLERLTAIRGTYPRENVLIAEAGCVLADVQRAARDVDRLFPLSLASEGSARIGGLLSTNAGGVNVLRYGNARAQVLGLEAVLPDGTVWHGLKRLHKDNTGYDLRHLLMGAEGTLGIITAASLKLQPRPTASGTAILTVASPTAALDLLALARDRLGDAISAFELIGQQGLSFLRETLPEVRLPFETDPPWCVLIEIGTFGEADPSALLESIFADAVERGLSDDGVIARSERQRDDLWSVRERIPEANRLIGAVSNHDISLPLEALPDFIDHAPERIANLGQFRINGFGHVGDGNLHYNVYPAPGRSRADHENQRDTIKEAIHDLVHEMGGSVSAEHGIGRLKVADLQRYGDPAKLAAMRAIKDALDPQGIMNPGAVLG